MPTGLLASDSLVSPAELGTSPHTQIVGLHLCWDFAAPDGIDAEAAVEELRDFAVTLPFDEVSSVMSGRGGDPLPFAGRFYPPVDTEGVTRPRDWNYPPGSSIRTLPLEPLEWFGFRVNAGCRVETAHFGLARYPEVPSDVTGCYAEFHRGWRWSDVCKTQTAARQSLDHFMTKHGSLVSLLDRAVSLNIVEEVRDQTGFFDSRDWRGAAEEIRLMNDFIDGFATHLQDVIDNSSDSSE